MRIRNEVKEELGRALRRYEVILSSMTLERTRYLVREVEVMKKNNLPLELIILTLNDKITGSVGGVKELFKEGLDIQLADVATDYEESLIYEMLELDDYMTEKLEAVVQLRAKRSALEITKRIRREGQEEEVEMTKERTEEEMLATSEWNLSEVELQQKLKEVREGDSQWMENFKRGINSGGDVFKINRVIANRMMLLGLMGHK